MHDLEKLRDGVHEVENLGNEEEQQGLTEVAQDSSHRNHHARKVCEGVANKHLGREPVEDQQGECGGGQGEHEVGGEEVAVTAAAAACITSHKGKMWVEIGWEVSKSACET